MGCGMRILGDHKRFLSVTRRDPVAMTLAAAAAILGVFVAFEIARDIAHSHLFHRLLARQETSAPAPAGISSADFSADAVELSGWAPANVIVRITEQGKEIAEEPADDSGKWTMAFADDDRRTLRTFLLSWQPKEHASTIAGQLALFVPDPSADEAWLWWRADLADAPHLLESPAPEEGDLALTLIQEREGQGPLAAGHAAPDSIVQLYNNNELIGTGVTDRQGRWIFPVMLESGKKSFNLRLDEITGATVQDRRNYKLPWPETKDNGDQPALLQTGNDSWMVGEPLGVDHAVMAILKPDAGTAMPPDKLIPGQIIPVAENKK